MITLHCNCAITSPNKPDGTIAHISSERQQISLGNAMACQSFFVCKHLDCFTAAPHTVSQPMTDEIVVSLSLAVCTILFSEVFAKLELDVGQSKWEQTVSAVTCLLFTQTGLNCTYITSQYSVTE